MNFQIQQLVKLHEQKGCQHAGCHQVETQGVWCCACIEWEWPFVRYNDSLWLVWKGVDPTDRQLSHLKGKFNCPYRLGHITDPNGVANWTLSPLGAIANPYGSWILGALIQKRASYIDTEYIIHSISSALPVKVEPKEGFLDPDTARNWLRDVPGHSHWIDRYEAYFYELAVNAARQYQQEIDRLSGRQTELMRNLYDEQWRKEASYDPEVPF